MARGYHQEEIKEKLVNLLKDSKTGLSGVEISEKIGISRVTMTKYLNIFSVEGLIRKKNIGNVTLWFVDKTTEPFQFPNDYALAQKKYIDLLLEYSENQVYSIIRNCIYSEAKIPLIMSEIIIPAIKQVRKTFDDGKFGNSELNLLNGIILKSIQLINLISFDPDLKKNVILISADSESNLLCESASASFRSENYSVYSLGDMSESINVLFDLDLQKFLRRIWKQKIGTMIIVVFSQSEEGLNFFANSINSVREKIEKKIHLALCGKIGKKTKRDADFVNEDLNAVFEWSKTTLEDSD